MSTLIKKGTLFVICDEATSPMFCLESIMDQSPTGNKPCLLVRKVTSEEFKMPYYQGKKIVAVVTGSLEIKSVTGYNPAYNSYGDYTYRCSLSESNLELIAKNQD